MTVKITPSTTFLYPLINHVIEDKITLHNDIVNSHEALRTMLDETMHLEPKNSPVFNVVCVFKSVVMGAGAGKGTLYILEFVTTDGQKKEVQLMVWRDLEELLAQLRRISEVEGDATAFILGNVKVKGKIQDLNNSSIVFPPLNLHRDN